jgi:type IV secretion system protein VirB9
LFSLETAKRDTPPTYILRFAYPQDAPVATVPVPPPCSNGPQNFAYYSWGDKDIAPNRVWDDGQFTCFEFSNSIDLPVIFKKMADGTEALVNTWKQKDVVIVHEVSPEYRLRLSKQVIGIKTSSSRPAQYNTRGTSDNSVREVIKTPISTSPQS